MVFEGVSDLLRPRVATQGTNVMSHTGASEVAKSALKCSLVDFKAHLPTIKIYNH